VARRANKARDTPQNLTPLPRRGQSARSELVLASLPWAGTRECSYIGRDGRPWVQGTDGQAPQAGSLLKRRIARRCHPAMGHPLEQGPQALHLAQDCRRDHREGVSGQGGSLRCQAGEEVPSQIRDGPLASPSWAGTCERSYIGRGGRPERQRLRSVRQAPEDSGCHDAPLDDLLGTQPEGGDISSASIAATIWFACASTRSSCRC